MRSLKVYTGSLDGRHSFCVATTSFRRVALIAKFNSHHTNVGYLQGYWSVTGNAEQIAVATAQPGVLFREEHPQRHDYRPYAELQAPSKFGFDHMVEIREITASLADRDLSPTELHFEAIRLYEERHKNDLTLRQRQELARQERLANPPPRSRLNAEEIAYLIDRLGGVNDPVGQSAREVLERMR